MKSEFNQQRLSELVALLCDDLINNEQFKELDEILKLSSEARRWYHIYMGLNHDLENSQVQVIVPNLVADQKPMSQKRNRFSVSSIVIAASVVFLIIGYTLYRNQQPVNVPEVVATITHLSNVQWEPESEQPSLNSPITSGRLRLRSGLIRLTYRHGVVLSLKGPADFEVRSTNHSILHRGQLAAYVPPGAEGFQVDSPNAKVVDLGTEFGITVDDRGETQLSVFDGKVELTPSVPNAETTIVSSGHGYRIADKGKTVRLFELAPYKEARDALRGWQTVWEPFGPGSPTGLYPGVVGAGWQSPWEVDISHGVPVKRKTGVFKKRSLHPGTHFYLSLGARSKRGENQVNAQMSRVFGSIDQFATLKPYTVELLIRIESKPEEMERLSIFSKPSVSKVVDKNSWQLDVKRVSPKSELSWQVAHRAGDNIKHQSLTVSSWTTYRCFIEVDPQHHIWRASVASQEESISNNLNDAIPLMNSADGMMRLGFEAVSKIGKPVSFSVDAIRIQNRPNGK